MNSSNQDTEQRLKQLFVTASSGDSAAYEEFLAAVSEHYFGYCLKCFGNQEAAEDCVQESLIAIHRAKETFDPKRPIKPWLHAIVKRKAIDHFRGNKMLFSESDADLEKSSTQHSTPLALNLEQGLAALTSSLEPKYKEAFVLRYLEGKSTKDAAEKLAISQAAFKVRVHRARKLVEKQIREKFFILMLILMCNLVICFSYT